MFSRLIQAGLALTVGLFVASGSRVTAQVSILPPRTAPVTPSDTTPPPAGSLPPANGPATPFVPQPPPPSPLTFAPVPPPPPAPPGGVDPGLTGFGEFSPPSLNAGLFFDAQVALLFPDLKYRALNDTPLPITGALLNVPTARLAATVAPTIEVGYRLCDGTGLFAINYTFFDATGNSTVNMGGDSFAVHTRASVNTVNLDYGTAPYEFMPRYTYSYRVGIRLSDVYFDSQAAGATLTQRATNHFFGAGPHARLDLERRIVPIPGLSLFGRIDAAVLVGRVSQNYYLQTVDDTGAAVADSGQANRTQAVPALNLQIGLSYAVESVPGLKFTAGYDFSDMWNVGRLGENSAGMVSATSGELRTNGIFFRGRYDF